MERLGRSTTDPSAPVPVVDAEARAAALAIFPKVRLDILLLIKLFLSIW